MANLGTKDARGGILRWQDMGCALNVSNGVLGGATKPTINGRGRAGDKRCQSEWAGLHRHTKKSILTDAIKSEFKFNLEIPSYYTWGTERITENVVDWLNRFSTIGIIDFIEEVYFPDLVSTIP